MLKTFRRMFSSKAPLEFDVGPGRPRDASPAVPDGRTEVVPLDALEQVSLVATTQAAAQSRIEDRLLLFRCTERARWRHPPRGSETCTSSSSEIFASALTISY